DLAHRAAVVHEDRAFRLGGDGRENILAVNLADPDRVRTGSAGAKLGHHVGALRSAVADPEFLAAAEGIVDVIDFRHRSSLKTTLGRTVVTTTDGRYSLFRKRTGRRSAPCC